VHDNLIHFFRRRREAFPFRQDIDLRHFFAESIERSAEVLPVPAKIFLVDELEPHGFGYPVMKSPALDEIETRAGKWIADEIAARAPQGSASKAEEQLAGYIEHVAKLAQNARQSSILADYHSTFWLLHTQQLARLFTALPRKTVAELPKLPREEGDRLKYTLFTKWAGAIREALPDEARKGFLSLILDNLLLATEEFINSDLRELRSYFSGHLRRDFADFKKSFDEIRQQAADLITRDRLLRRAVSLLGYPESTMPPFVAMFDKRVLQLLGDHPSFRPTAEQHIIESLSRRLLEALVVQHLRRGIYWMKTTEDGDNVADDGTETVYSRAIRPMNFGRRGVVEPVVYRYGLVYDITSFTQTLGEIARGGKGEEQHGYRQMLEFQRELAEISRRHGLQFEKFLGDGAFYTSRRATRVIEAALEIQQFYSQARERGFAFNKGMRIALNYGYYRLLPMQVSTDGTQIMEFYGPGIVELSRLTTGKATKELEDVQHLLLSHGYDQSEVYKFFAPLSRSVEDLDATQQQREFYAYVNEAGHLINEGIVVSIPFLKQLSLELTEDGQKMYRVRTPWAVYLGFRWAKGYIALRIVGSVTLKGIGQQEVGEVVHATTDTAEISVLDESKPLLTLLQQERNRSAAAAVRRSTTEGEDVGTADLVVCESPPVILVGEWDPVSEEVRRPIRLNEIDAERYGLSVPLSAERVEAQSLAYQKLYRTLSRIETLPSFSVDAIRQNANFAGFIIGATVERL
jgi:hypothetical protein